MPDIETLHRQFAEAYGVEASVAVRAPGRVNLIGEHTDYSELPVLPIAIEQSVIVLVAPTDEPVLEAKSAHFEPPARMERGEPHAAAGTWQRYLAGALGQMENVARGRGAKLLVAGDLPAAGGLSSSSALTMGVLAALSHAWGEPLAPEDLVARAIVAERHSGVESGGMDQTVIAFAEAGHALRIDFRPPERRQVPIPPGLALIVAYSGEEAPKGGAARDAYNERVVGTRIAALMLADQLGVDLDDPPTLGQVADADVVDILVDGLPEKISAHEVSKATDVELARVVGLTAGTFDDRQKVAVKRLARHVLEEARRVDDAEAALRAGDLRAFGKLLDASHNSLREDFRASTPALDRLCVAMRKAGALGARLTGAGFGGYALAACEPGMVVAVTEAALGATGGPAFEVHASGGLELL